MSASMLKRIRERVVGGAPNPWDHAMARGVSIAAFLLAWIFARGQQIDDIPVLGLREEAFLALFAVGPALLVAWPLALLMTRLVGSVDSPATRQRQWLIAGAGVLLIAGFASPLALRAAWMVEPGMSRADEPLAWLVSEVPAAAWSGVPPGGTSGEPSHWHASDIASRASTWTAVLGAWLACWPLVRRRVRVHVGWPVALSFGVLAVGAMMARTFVASRQDSVAPAILAALAASVLPCLLAWRFVASAGARWPQTQDPGEPAALRRWEPFGAARVAACAIAAIAAWLGFLAVMSPPALRSLADSWHAPPRVGEMAPLFSLKDPVGAELRLADLRGKPVLVSFGASWCGPCTREFPHLAELSETGGGVGLAVLWISKDTDRSALDAFLAKQAPSQPQARSPRVLIADADVLLAYDVDAIPSKFLMDSTGRIAWRQVGFGPKSLETLNAAIAALASPI